MKLMTSLKTPAKNTEQRIFKFVLFIVLPLLAIMTAYSYSRIKTNKDDVAKNKISTQSGNANKRLTIFLDPLSRDIAYLQVRANEGKLDPKKASEVREFLTLFSQFYLQNVKDVIFWDGISTKIFSINQNDCTGPEETTESFYNTAFKDTLKKSDPNMIDWIPAKKESFLLAATVFNNSKSGPSNIIALVNSSKRFSWCR